MKDRIKKIRKKNQLTQAAFGERIGVKGNTITNYESGARNPTDAVLLAICREFNVNEKWLRTGEGDMELQLNREDRHFINVGKLQRTDDETIIRWADAVAETSPETLRNIEEFLKKILGIE